MQSEPRKDSGLGIIVRGKPWVRTTPHKGCVQGLKRRGQVGTVGRHVWEGSDPR